ncbi:unnamed protein product [Polarella glacialis]|uniref:Uncharacterized protein n=1 Tax=Polarella glacialis TaxID=89957 RepID=A0A813D4V4_POLGL|nr:unnamed protein product [Polarella glacialis]
MAAVGNRSCLACFTIVCSTIGSAFVFYDVSPTLAGCSTEGSAGNMTEQRSQQSQHLQKEMPQMRQKKEEQQSQLEVQRKEAVASRLDIKQLQLRLRHMGEAASTTTTTMNNKPRADIYKAAATTMVVIIFGCFC